MLMTLDSHTNEISGVTTFKFVPNNHFSYIAGQYAELNLRRPDLPASENKRWFTLSSSPTEDFISITTRLNRQPLTTFKRVLVSLEAGAVVDISMPLGDFVLPKDQGIPLVFVAVGIGITPVRSIIKALLDANESRLITLIYAVKQPEEAMFLDIFSQYDLNMVLVPTKHSADWKGPSGRLTGKLVLEQSSSHENSIYYLSGPEGAIEALGKELVKRGIKPSRIVSDLFSGYKEG